MDPSVCRVPSKAEQHCCAYKVLAALIFMVSLGGCERSAAPTDFQGTENAIDVNDLPPALASSTDSIPWVNDTLSFDQDGVNIRFERQLQQDGGFVLEMFADDVYAGTLAVQVVGGAEEALAVGPGGNWAVIDEGGGLVEESSEEEPLLCDGDGGVHAAGGGEHHALMGGDPGECDDPHGGEGGLLGLPGLGDCETERQARDEAAEYLALAALAGAGAALVSGGALSKPAGYAVYLAALNLAVKQKKLDDCRNPPELLPPPWNIQCTPCL